jgi:hypothetical protein
MGAKIRNGCILLVKEGRQKLGEDNHDGKPHALHPANALFLGNLNVIAISKIVAI